MVVVLCPAPGSEDDWKLGIFIYPLIIGAQTTTFCSHEEQVYLAFSVL